MTSQDKKLTALLAHDSTYFLKRFPAFNINEIKQVILFGAGQMGSIYMKFFDKLGVSVIAFCDNDSAKIGKRMQGVPVMGINDIKIYSKKIPIVVTSIFDDEISSQLNKKGFTNVWSHAFLATFYEKYFPNPYWNNPIEKLIKSRDELANTLQLFSEPQSRNVFLNIIKYRLFLDRKFIEKVKSPTTGEYFDKEIIKLSNEIYVDGGAYDGDTIRKFKKASRNNYDKIFAFEPDASSFKKLSKFVNTLNDKRIKVFRYGLAEKNKTLMFSNDGTLGSRADDSSGIKIKAISLDNLLSEERVTMLKMDIEGAEIDALYGARNLIKSLKPKLAICIYHKPNDIWQIPLFIKALRADYKFYIRHYSSFLYDTIIYAI